MPPLEDPRDLHDAWHPPAQAERMAALGRLTAGIAHELNNPLGFVKNNLAMLEEYLDLLLPLVREALARRSIPTQGGQDLAAILADIEPLLTDTRGGLGRLETALGGLRRFARPDIPEGEPFDLNQCVRDSLQVAWNELKYRAQVVQEFADLPPLHGRPGAINHLVLDLLLGAARSLPRFGEIQVHTRRLGEGAQLIIAHDGPAMAHAALEPLIRPDGAAPALPPGGRLEVADTPGGGREFRLFLPLPETGP